MKKIVMLAVASGLISGVSYAATVGASAGLPAQGITFQVDYQVAEGFQAADAVFFQPGNWNGAVWTGFGTPTSIVGELKGGVTAFAPSSLEGLPVHIYVGTAAAMADSTFGSWVILQNTPALEKTFPVPITGTGSVTFNAALPANVIVLATGNPQNGFIAESATGSAAAFNLVSVPEASTALLGLIGLAGLVRRRR